MIELSMNVEKCDLTYTGADTTIVAGSREYVLMTFSMCPDWQAMTDVVASFRTCRRLYSVDVVGGECEVPHEALVAPGFTVGLMGTDQDGVQRIVSTVVAFEVENGEPTPGPGSVPTETLYDRIIKANKDADALIARLEEQADATEKASADAIAAAEKSTEDAQAAESKRAETFGASMQAWAASVDAAVGEAQSAAAEAQAHAANFLGRGLWESSALVHVEDAFPSPVRGLKVYGRSVQDTDTYGNPSPENPVPIVSIGAADVCVSGADTEMYTTTTVSLTAEDGTAYELRGIGDVRDYVSIEGGRWVLHQKFGEGTLDASLGWSSIGSDGTMNFRTSENLGSKILQTTGLKLNAICDTMTFYAQNQIQGKTDYEGIAARTNGLGFVVNIASLRSSTVDDFNAWIAENPIHLIFELEEERIIDLGPADTPLLPETVSNVWAVSTPATDLAIEYERDLTLHVLGAST